MQAKLGPRTLTQALEAADPLQDLHTAPAAALRSPSNSSGPQPNSLEQHQQQQRRSPVHAGLVGGLEHLGSRDSACAGIAISDQRPQQPAATGKPDEHSGSLEQPGMSMSHVSQSVLSCNSHDSVKDGAMATEQHSRQGHASRQAAQAQEAGGRGKDELDLGRGDALEPAGAAGSPAPVISKQHQPSQHSLSRRLKKCEQQVSLQPSQVPQQQPETPAGGDINQKSSEQRLSQPQSEKLQQQREQSTDKRLSANRTLRDESNNASAVHAESQQSAVHALLPPVQAQQEFAQGHQCRLLVLHGQALLEGSAALPGGDTQQSVVDGPADKADPCDRSRKRGRPWSDTTTCDPIDATDTNIVTRKSRRDRSGSSQDCNLVGLHKPKGMQATHCIAAGKQDSTRVSAIFGHATMQADDPLKGPCRNQAVAGCKKKPRSDADTAAPSVKRHLRSRDIDANKPWWVV